MTMITAQEAALESIFQKIARVMTRRSNVTVSIRGLRAFINLETMQIVLPSLTDEQARNIEHLMDGYLDHEDAHALYTDPKCVAPLLPDGRPDRALKYMLNALEDVRIEALKSAAYPGCRDNIKRLNDELDKDVAEAWNKLDAINRLTHALQKCWSGEREPAYYATEPMIGAIVQMLIPEIEDGRHVVSTSEALDVATRVLAKIKSTSELAAAVESANAEQPNGGGSLVIVGVGGKSAQPTDGAGAAGGKPGADGKAAGGVGQAAGDDAGGDPGEVSEQALAQAANFQQVKDSDKFSEPLDATGLLNRRVLAVVIVGSPPERRYGGPKDYVVFSEDKDTDKTYSLQERARWTSDYPKYKASVQQHIGTMATHLELSLAAITQARFVGGERRGKHFDRRKFAAWSEGSEDDRIFRQLVPGERIDTAITMLWDCSGSMAGPKADLARVSAIAFHEALLRCSIAHEVLGFNTGGGNDPQLAQWAEEARRAGDDINRYARVDELNNHMVFVPYGQSDGRAICAITGAAANRDGEAVLWASKRLAARPETRKILIVGSDGQPAGSRHGQTERDYLREVVQRAIAAGLEVYGIGIMDDSVADYYPTYVVIESADDLPRAVMGQLAAALTGQKGRTNNAVTGRGAGSRRSA